MRSKSSRIVLAGGQQRILLQLFALVTVAELFTQAQLDLCFLTFLVIYLLLLTSSLSYIFLFLLRFLLNLLRLLLFLHIDLVYVDFVAQRVEHVKGLSVNPYILETYGSVKFDKVVKFGVRRFKISFSRLVRNLTTFLFITRILFKNFEETRPIISTFKLNLSQLLFLFSP